MVDRSQEMLCRTLELAEKSVRAYEEGLRSCESGPGKEVFGRLLEDERFYIERIKEIHAGLVAGQSWAEACVLPDKEGAEPGLAEIAGKHGVVEACATEVGAIDSALGVQKERLEFFEEWLRRTEHPVERTFVERMIQEERGRFILLNDLHYFFEDPKGWSLKEGHQILDGA
jgi:hypothetical protein